jgi:L-alanine-DL-glutamate epimerase-like enolase superfamily enzyme
VRVTDVRTKILSVPYRISDRWSGGENGGLTTVLVFVDTDDGLTGVGEANGDRSATAVVQAINAMKPLVVGRSPFEIEATVSDIFKLGKWRNVRPFANQAVVGIETALWDVVGKACQQPLVNLMGGPVRDKVDFFFYLQQADRENMVEEACNAQRDGYHVIYLKIGVDDDEELKTISALRDALGPDAKIRVDANEAWSPGHAVAMIERLAPIGIDFVEQPVGARDLDGLARVRATSRVPIAANQSAFTHFDVLEVIKRGAADVIVTGPHQAGGLLQLKKIAAMAETAGLPLNRHAVGELGVGALAGLHVSASIVNLTDGNQTHHQLLIDDVLTEPLKFKDGCLSVPDLPGIGAVLDEEKVEKYERLYETQGQYYNFA